MEKYNIIVSAEFDHENQKVNVSISQPNEEKKLDFRSIAHILTSGIMLLTKLVNETSEIKDYQLMKEIIDHMNSEFVSLTSFSDAKIIV